MITDIDGEGSHAIGGQMMRGSVYCDEDEASSPASKTEHVKSGEVYMLYGQIWQCCIFLDLSKHAAKHVFELL